jgi:hypothetical protein
MDRLCPRIRAVGYSSECIPSVFFEAIAQKHTKDLLEFMAQAR